MILDFCRKPKPIVASTSPPSAHTLITTVASFRTWRGSQPDVAKRPILATIGSSIRTVSEREGFEPSIRYERINAFQAFSFDRSDISPEGRKGKLPAWLL